MTGADQTIPIDTAGEVTLPVVDVMTGRGFINGQSGAGKTGTATVLGEELFDLGYSVLIVDTEGEYWGLKETYEVLHVGTDEECDLQVGPEHGEKLAALALEENVSIILDVSGFVDDQERHELIRETCDQLFGLAETVERPFLVIVEELHEYLPQQGSSTPAGDQIKQIAKRGRKRGLGLIATSQRPAAVDKDFITQCDWIVWHRLVWENDTRVARNVLGTDTIDGVELSDLDPGEAFLDAKFLDGDPFRVQVRPQRTFEAGATPGLEAVEEPALKSVDDDLLEELQAITEEQDAREDQLAQLEAENDQLRERIAELEEKLDEARQVDRTADRVLEKLSGGDQSNGETPATADPETAGSTDRGHEGATAHHRLLQGRYATEPQNSGIERLEAELDPPPETQASDDALEALCADLNALIEQHAAVLAVDEDTQALRERIRELEAETERRERELDAIPPAGEYYDHLTDSGIRAAVRTAAQDSDYADEHFDHVLGILAVADGGPLTVNEIAPLADVSETVVRSVLNDLHDVGVVQRENESRPQRYRLDCDLLERRGAVANNQASPA